MHIMEGFLPVGHAVAWTVASAPFVAYGLYSIKRRIREKPEQRMLLGVAAAFTFVLSALKLPSGTGSCSHPTGTGMGAILFGPAAMAPIGLAVLLFQALLLAHGGITTLGANLFSMAVVGPCTAAAIHRCGRAAGLPFSLSVFLAASVADILTYVTTAFQLAIAFPDPVTGLAGSLVKFLGLFALTQIPLAVSEGLLTVVVFNGLKRFNRNELEEMNVMTTREARA